MKDKDLPGCALACINVDVPCPFEDCRYWISHEKEKNCSLVSIYVNGPMTLHEIGARLGISFVRVCQIEKKLVEKLKANPNLLKLLIN